MHNRNPFARALVVPRVERRLSGIRVEDGRRIGTRKLNRYNPPSVGFDSLLISKQVRRVGVLFHHDDRVRGPLAARVPRPSHAGLLLAEGELVVVDRPGLFLAVGVLKVLVVPRMNGTSQTREESEKKRRHDRELQPKQNAWFLSPHIAGDLRNRTSQFPFVLRGRAVLRLRIVGTAAVIVAAYPLSMWWCVRA